MNQELLTLAQFTTSRVGGPAQEWIRCTTLEELVAAVEKVDATGKELLLLGGGSNLLVTDEPLARSVIHIQTAGFQLTEEDHRQVTLLVAAGQPWDEFVAEAVDRGYSGLEALSGIPGHVGATPVQNVGAYGAEVAETLTRVHVYDRHLRQQRWLSNEELEFSYRDSLIKRTTTVPGSPRYVVLEVEFALDKSVLSSPIRYTELARQLGVGVGDRAPADSVREMVLRLRTGKGMVLDAADHDTWSTGSFFTNPIVPAELASGLPEEAPRFPAGKNEAGFELVKLSAAWLIDHAGFKAGYSLSPGASLSTKHTLALTNRGQGSCEDMVKLASHVREGVAAKFGIRLEPEPLLIGCQLSS